MPASGPCRHRRSFRDRCPAVSRSRAARAPPVPGHPPHARAEAANPTLILGRAADAEVLLRAIESGAVKKIWPVGVLSQSAGDQGQSIRGIPVLGYFSALDAVVNDFAQRDTPISRVIFTPSAFEPDAKPEATLMHARRLGLAVSRLPSLDQGGDVRHAAGGESTIVRRHRSFRGQPGVGRPDLGDHSVDDRRLRRRDPLGPRRRTH